MRRPRGPSGATLVPSRAKSACFGAAPAPRQRSSGGDGSDGATGGREPRSGETAATALRLPVPQALVRNRSRGTRRLTRRRCHRRGSDGVAPCDARHFFGVVGVAWPTPGLNSRWSDCSHPRLEEGNCGATPRDNSIRFRSRIRTPALPGWLAGACHLPKSIAVSQSIQANPAGKPHVDLADTSHFSKGAS